MEDLELFIFDLDRTLTKSRSNIDEEMSKIISELLKHKRVVVISGAEFSQFKKQLIDLLPESANLNNLYIAPLTGGSFYRFEENNWNKVYEEILSEGKRAKIINSLEKAVEKNKFLQTKKVYGKQIQDRGGQITFSALGDKAPLDEKTKWDPNIEKRLKLKEILDKDLNEFEVSAGGSTSIDIREKGIDKAYGINKILPILSTTTDKTIFFGDAIYEGGNDYSVVSTGIKTQKVSGPEETKKILKEYLKNN